ncbi:MAG: hypothetical protein FRX49_01660 [Trebouxia sp. A1-2]|nr:MAG: hypothetical protein FRX49_01660 [Trebouxia sp. A1-2]
MQQLGMLLLTHGISIMIRALHGQPIGPPKSHTAYLESSAQAIPNDKEKVFLSFILIIVQQVLPEHILADLLCCLKIRPHHR